MKRRACRGCKRLKGELKDAQHWLRWHEKQELSLSKSLQRLQAINQGLRAHREAK